MLRLECPACGRVFDEAQSEWDNAVRTGRCPSCETIITVLEGWKSKEIQASHAPRELSQREPRSRRHPSLLRLPQSRPRGHRGQDPPRLGAIRHKQQRFTSGRRQLTIFFVGCGVATGLLGILLNLDALSRLLPHVGDSPMDALLDSFERWSWAPVLALATVVWLAIRTLYDLLLVFAAPIPAERPRYAVRFIVELVILIIIVYPWVAWR